MEQRLLKHPVMLSNFFDRDDEYDHVATPSEACREYARNVGAERPESPFIRTDFDTLERNPYFTGPLCHQLIDFDSDDGFESLEAHADCERSFCKASWKGPRHDPYLAGRGTITAHLFATDDDLPF